MPNGALTRVMAPAVTATPPTSQLKPVEVKGSRLTAQAPRDPKTTKRATAKVGLRRAANPARTPTPRVPRVTPTSSIVFCAVPRVSMLARTTPPGAPSMMTPATATTKDSSRLLIPAANSPIPRARAALSMPATAEPTSGTGSGASPSLTGRSDRPPSGRPSCRAGSSSSRRSSSHGLGHRDRRPGRCRRPLQSAPAAIGRPSRLG